MIQSYIHNIISTIPSSSFSKCIHMDLILDAGLFNGSYMIGALFFIKEMEKKNLFKVHRISACSVGTICALLYKLDALHLMTDLYNIILQQVKTKHNLDCFPRVFSKLEITEPQFNQLLKQNAIYISYYDIRKCIKCVKSSYSSIQKLLNTIRKSCYIPFIIDGKLSYHNKYIDGINPYIFPPKKNRKMLYIELYGLDKIKYTYSIKNESSNLHRILAGILDIHLFYIKNENTQMCSYVNDWNTMQHGYFNMKRLIETIVSYLFYLMYLITNYLKNTNNVYYKYYSSSILSKIIYKTIKEIYILVLNEHCI